MATENRPPSSVHEAETTPVHSRPASSSAEAVAVMLKQEHPERVGPYNIIRLIGQGGMGLVYLAQRDEGSFSQRVALKLIKKGMDSDEILRRFELERQLLSGLSHPNIARLIDGGTNEDGRPYFALEYIEGQPIDRYCDANRLTTRQRLDLFRKVCSAVHYAHQNLIVHRDLKPGNVLVTAGGEPKLLDFGIAKLLNPTLFQVQAVTGPAVRLMTPEYASPEQVRGDPITTSSDIYSLGVMLYELLTGRRPYKFKTRLQDEIARIICEESPEKPSTVISHAAEEPIGEGKTRRIDPGTVADTREGDLVKLRKRLRGDIDDIVLKALEKTPNRRYSSAEQLSEDINRHINGEPVIARPPSTFYRIGKFVQRNRNSVIAAAAIFFALTIGVIGTTAMWSRAEAAFAQADAARNEEAAQRAAAEAAKTEAETQRARAEAAFQDLLKISLAFINNAQTSIARLPASLQLREDFVKTGAGYIEQLSKAAADDHTRFLDLSAAYERLGTLQADIRGPNKGNTPKALEFQRQALALRQKLLDADPANPTYINAVSISHLRIGDLLITMGELSAAEQSYTTAVSLIEKIDGEDAASAPARTRLAAAIAKVAEIHNRRAELTAARPLIDRADSLRRALATLKPGPDARRNITVGTIDLAILLRDQGNFAESLAQLEIAVKERRALYAESPEQSRTQRDLAVALWESSTARRLMDDPVGAIRDAGESRELLSKLNAANRDTPDSRDLHFLAVANIRMGEALRASAEKDASPIDEAHRAFDAAVGLLTPLLASDPENADVKRDLAAALSGAAATLDLQQKHTQAIEPIERASALITDLMNRSPSDLTLVRLATVIEYVRSSNSSARLNDPSLTPEQAAELKTKAGEQLRNAAKLAMASSGLALLEKLPIYKSENPAGDPPPG